MLIQNNTTWAKMPLGQKVTWAIVYLGKDTTWAMWSLGQKPTWAMQAGAMVAWAIGDWAKVAAPVNQVI